MNLVSKTGNLSNHTVKEGFDILKNTINSTVDVVNNILISTCNINKEFNRPNETFTIESAAALVPANRRS
jgi:hypothetical protein